MNIAFFYFIYRNILPIYYVPNLIIIIVKIAVKTTTKPSVDFGNITTKTTIKPVINNDLFYYTNKVSRCYKIYLPLL